MHHKSKFFLRRTIQNNSQLMYRQVLLVYERLFSQCDEIDFIISKLTCKENLFHHWDRKCLTTFRAIF